jgi:hypothetical protein
MPSIANRDISSLFTIPAADWTLINQRVGDVLQAEPFKEAATYVYPGYPGLLASCGLWTQSTWHALISQAYKLADYAAEAITNFGNLQQQVKAITGNGPVPESIQVETMLILHQLAGETSSLAIAFDTLSKQLIDFMSNNQLVDAQMAAEKNVFGNDWLSIQSNIIQLENATGSVTDKWQAIKDDLNNILVQSVDVTQAFIESLNIEAAIICWQNIHDEAAAFPVSTSGQEQYWAWGSHGGPE